jgi:hypothetical protein
MHELSMRSFAASANLLKPCQSQVFDEVTDFLGMSEFRVAL